MWFLLQNPAGIDCTVNYHSISIIGNYHIRAAQLYTWYVSAHQYLDYRLSLHSQLQLANYVTRYFDITQTACGALQQSNKSSSTIPTHGALVLTKLSYSFRIALIVVYTSNTVLDTVLSNAHLVTLYVPKPDGAVVWARDEHVRWPVNSYHPARVGGLGALDHWGLWEKSWETCTQWLTE